MTSEAPGLVSADNAVRSGIALVARTSVVMLAGFIRVALVARAIGPLEMGVFAILTLVVEAASALTYLGPAAVLVQRPEAPRSYFDTLWVFKIGQGLFSGLVVIAAYPMIGLVSASPSSLWLHVSVAGALLLSAVSSPYALVQTRQGRFGRVAMNEAIVAVVDCVATSFFAFQLRSAMAVGLGALARSAAEVALSWGAFPGRISLRIDPRAAREFLSAGWHMMLNALASYAMLFGDNAMVGAFLGARPLGLYVVAYRLADLPSSTLFAISRRLLFPLLSRLQSEPARLRATALRTLSIQMHLLWPFVGVVVTFADLIVRVVFGPAFAEAGGVLRALGFLTFGRAVTTSIGTVLLASGRFDYVTRLKWIEVSAFLPTLALGLYLGGLVGAALAAGITFSLVALRRVLSLSREQGLAPGDTLRALFSPALPTLVAVALTFGAGLGLAHPALLLGTFVVTWIGMIVLTQRPLLRETADLLQRALGRTSPS